MSGSKPKDIVHVPDDPNAGAGDPTDARARYQWQSRYPSEVWQQIIVESVYLLALFAFSIVAIFLNWSGWLPRHLGIPLDRAAIFQKYAYYAASGMLGGSLFGIKYFYRVIARGYWHQDRVIWRIKSPLLAAGLAFAVGALIDASLIQSTGPNRPSAFISVGFLVGHFADQAIAKMYEVAMVLFGTSAKKSGEIVKAGDER